MFQSWKNRRQSSGELTDEQLSAYLDDQMPLEDRATLDARLRREQALVTRLEGLRQTKRALASLPRVDVPRNFILAPSMVAPPKRVAPPRQRPTWPLFAWATAIATLLLLVVFAGDFFFYAPPTHTQPSDVIALQPQPLGQAASENGVEHPAALTETAASVGEAPAEAGAEEVVPEAEALVETAALAETAAQEPVETEVVEKEIVLESEAVAEKTVEGEPAPPAIGGGGEAPIEEGPETQDAETPSFLAAPAPGVAVTVTIEGKEVVVTASPPSEDGIADEAASAAEPSAEEAETESDIDTLPLRKLDSEATPDVVARAPEDLPSAVDVAGQGTDDATPWLRLAEIGLGLAILALATVTLILRRREA